MEDRCLLTAGVGQFIGGQFVGDDSSFGIALGDFDADGDLDAFVANAVGGDDGFSGAPNRVYRNDGGTFVDSGQTLGNLPSFQVALADLDDDGDLDAFVGNIGGNTLWLNDGTGVFTDLGVSLGAGMSIDVSLGDLDGDGDIDAAVANASFVDGLPTAGAVWLNDGAATPGFTNSASGLWGSGWAAGIDLGDIDGDGDLDALVTQAANADDTGPGSELLFLNDGSGSFTDSGQQLGSEFAFGGALGDLDGDGDLDAYVVGNDRHGDRVYVNQGGSQSGTPGIFTDSGQELETGRDAMRVALVDLDGDDDLDAFVVAQTNFGADAGHRVLINQGGDQGGTEGVFVSDGRSLSQADTVGVALGDIDGNGTIDAVVANADGPNRVWLNQLHPVLDYETRGNVAIDVPVANGLLEGTSGLTVTDVDDSATEGIVSVAADGAFLYTPATGFFGTDTFTITRSDSEQFVVAVDVGTAIWFVNQDAASGGDGTPAAPFQSLTPLNSASDVDSPGDLIFIIGQHNTYDIASANGFVLEHDQDLYTTWGNPFASAGGREWLGHLGHVISPFSVGLPTEYTVKSTLTNSVAGAPVLQLLGGGNQVNSIDIDPGGASEAVLIDEVSGDVDLWNIHVIPGAGDHSYNGVSVINSSNVFVGLHDFVIGNNTDSTTSGTAIHIDGGDNVNLLIDGTSNVFQIGGGLLNMTNTTNSSGEAKVVFDPSTTLRIDNGDFGFNLLNNDGGRFGFDGDFFLNNVTTGITAVNSGTIEMPKDAEPAQRDVSTDGGHALQVEHISTGEDGWHFDHVNSWGGTIGILFDDVAGGGIHINQTEITSATQLAVDVSDTPNTVFDFGELMIMGDTLVADTYVGNGTAGRSGDGGDANEAELNMPSDLTFDRHGNMFITDFAENVVRRMDVITETVTTIAGTGTAGFSGDGGLATSAELNGPLAVVVDDDGNVFIADAGNHRIRRIDGVTGFITTVAGTGTGGYSGDNGSATSASLNFPVDLAFAHDGSLFVSDHENHRIRRIDGDSGIITTAVGTGEAGSSPENTPPASAKLNLPWGIAFIANGELGIVDSGNNRMVGVDWQANEVFTNVGTGFAGNTGNESNDPRQFALDDPRGLAVHPDGMILITDYNNHRVVGYDPLEESVNTVAGTGTAGFSGDNIGSAENAQFNEPISVAVAPWGDIFVADVVNHRVRAIFFDFSPGEGVVLEDNPGSTFNFDRLSVRATTEAFVADNSGTINVGRNHFIYGDNAMLQAENGRALDITDTTLSDGEGGPATFRHVLSVASPRDGIILDNVSGDIVIDSGIIAWANQDGAPFTSGISIEDGEGGISIFATVVNTTGRSIYISGRSGGDIHLVTPVEHNVDGTSAIVIENNVAGNTTFYRPLDINSGSAAAVVESNNADHVVTFVTEGFPPDDDDGDIRTIEVSPFERLEPFGSLVSVSGTETSIAAGETVEFVVDIDDSQTLVGFVDNNIETAAFTMELVGLSGGSGIITGAAEGFVSMPLQQIADEGTYTIRVTSNTTTDIELVLILNAEFEADESPDAPVQPIDAAFNGGPNGGGWAAVGVTFPEAGPNDVDEFSVDLTGHVGRNIDVIVTGFEGQHYEDQTLELLAPDGSTVLATGSATSVGGTNASNFDLGILSFEVPADGVYTARITAPFDDVAYTLFVGYGLTFDAEPNNDRVNDDLRTIVANDLAIGHLHASTDAADFYEIELIAGEVVTLSTAFAHAPHFSPLNTLNPELEVFAPNGNSLATDADSGDGDHAEITFTAFATGTYVVRIGATSGAGEYLILTDVQAPAAPTAEFGDAPSAAQSGFANSYPVTLAEDGARHGDAGATLGGNLDLEADGIHSANADGDDTNGAPDDEDGVVFAGGAVNVLFSAASTGSVEIDLQDPHLGSNRLDAWIDWNRDGDWMDAGEQILTNYDLGLSSGVQTVSFVIPQDFGTNVQAGTTFSRFRISSTGSLAPTGFAADGEVEDHAVTIVQPDQSLSVSIAQASVSEGAGNDATTGTVTRDGDLTNDLIVTLASSDLSAATVDTTITIPAGQSTSPAFNITAVDDSDVDGTQTVTITASAAGYTDVTDSLNVTDDDVAIPNRPPHADAGSPYRFPEGAALSLDASASSDPDGDTLSYRWDINGDGSFDENVTGATPTLSWAELLGMEIPVGASSRVITLEVSDGELIDTDQTTLTVESILNPVTLSGTTTAAFESLGSQVTITATANRAVDGDQTVDVVVTGAGITASDYSLSNAKITIPDGQFSGSITFTVLDDADVEDTEAATVSIANPSANIVLGAVITDTVSIASDDVLTLAVSLDKSSISEDDGSALATVTRNGSTSGALVVDIGSNDRSEISIPLSVTIPEGHSSATFAVTGLSDTLVDGTRTASIVASATGFVQGLTHIDVTDTDVPELTVEFATSSISETGSVLVTVIRNTGGNGALGMVLVSDNTELVYPESIEIVNNSDRVTFTVYGIADGLVDGTQAVEFSASSPGFTSIVSTFNVTDLDTAELSLAFDPGTISENGGIATGTVTRNTPTTDALTVNVALSSGEVTSVATVEIPAGETSATFEVTGIDDSISNGSRIATITTSADGFASASRDITVADDDAIGIVSIIAELDAEEFQAVNGEFVIEMTTASSLDTEVELSYSGSATSGIDFTALPTSVTIPAGLLSAPLTMPVLDDSAAEDEETLTVTIVRIVSENAFVDEDADFDTITIADNDRDLIAPTATVQTLPLSTNTSTFTLNVDLHDAASDNGQPVSGVSTYDLYVAVDNGAFALHQADIPASQTTIEFVPESNRRYWFKTVAKDAAGNIEEATPGAETSTYVGDVAAPETTVVSATADAATGEITLHIGGTDAGNSGLDRFRIYVSIDGGPPEEIPASAVNAGSPTDGTYSDSVVYQGLRDGAAHTYRFFTIGVDGAGNIEAEPTAGTADLQIAETFAAPSGGLDASGIDIQNGETQRSYVRYVDVLFNDVTGLQELIDNDQIQIERFDLDDNTPDAGTGSLISPTAANTNGNAIKLDFGSTGIGGSGRAGNGFYRLAVDLDGDGLFDDAAFEFFRLYGDSNGDGEVTSADRTATEDLNGDGRINSRDRAVYRRERGRKLHEDLFPELDD